MVEQPFVEASGEVLRGEKMLLSGTAPESDITACTVVYDDKNLIIRLYTEK